MTRIRGRIELLVRSGFYRNVIQTRRRGGTAEARRTAFQLIDAELADECN